MSQTKVTISSKNLKFECLLALNQSELNKLINSFLMRVNSVTPDVKDERKVEVQQDPLPIALPERKDYKLELITPIPFDNFHRFTYIIRQAYRNNSSIKVKGESDKIYRVVFDDFPVCSCPSYYYNSEKKNKGACKHVDKVISELENINLNWNERPPKLPLKMKQLGIDEFQWITS